MNSLNAREEILKAAERLFGKVGFDGTTTREITELSGVNKALMYYYFKNKDALLESVLERYFARLDVILLEAIEGEGDLRSRADRVIDAYVDFLRRNINFSRIVQRESSGGKHMDTIFKHFSPLFEAGLATVREAYPESGDGEMAAEELIVSFYGMAVIYFTVGPLLGRLMGTDPLSKEAVARRKKHLHRMLDLVVEGIGDDRKERSES